MAFLCSSVRMLFAQVLFVPLSIQSAKTHYQMAYTIRTILVILSTGISIPAIAQESWIDYQLTGDDSILEKNLTPSLVFTPFIATQKSDTQIDWTVMASAHSPAQPIAAFIKDWDAPLDSGKHAYAQGRTSLNVRPADSPISYGLAWRYDYMTTFSQETADLYWQYQNKQLPNQNQTYALELDAQHNERFGANVGFAQQLTSNWQLTTYANIWKGLHLLDGEAKGSITSQAYPDGEIVRNIDRLNRTKTYVDYYYDKPALGEEDLNWHPNKPTGYGYSLDISLTGTLTDRTRLSVRGYDVLGRMHWKDTPSTQYVLDYDANRRPIDMTEGQLDTDDITQTLPWRVEGSLIHQLNPQWQLGVHGQVNDIQGLYQLSAGYQTNEDYYPLIITGLIEPQTQALGLAVDSQYGGIRLLTDSLDSEKAQRSEVSLYGRYSW